MFMHGGGMVFGSSEVQDPMLERVAASTGMACASVEYRLAPEHPYPAAWEDCESVADWLVKNAASEFGTGVLTIGGESAGATLAVATLLRRRDRHGDTGFRAANLAYGNYDASMTPWLAAGNDAELAIDPGATHAFNTLPMPQGKAADARIDAFLNRAIA